MSTKSKVILGLVGAAAAGVIVGLLVAPVAGNATRKKITSTAGDWTSHLGDLFSSAKDEVNAWTKKGAKAANDVSDRYSDVKESYS